MEEIIKEEMKSTIRMNSIRKDDNEKDENTTTIRVSIKLKEYLDNQKIARRETYEELLWRLLKVQ